VQKPSEIKPVADTVPPRRYLHISWDASDPNQDRLNFNLFLKKLPDGDWQLLRDEVKEKWLYLDSELFADGKYLLKVQADDGLDNTPSWIKTAVKISIPFIIDSTAPVLSEFALAAGRVRFMASDESSAVAQVHYSFDGKSWHPVFPEDMVGDSRSEKFDFLLNNSKNSHVLFIKIADEFDNYKVFQKSI
jgi:hypothetical protein